MRNFNFINNGTEKDGFINFFMFKNTSVYIAAIYPERVLAFFTLCGDDPEYRPQIEKSRVECLDLQEKEVKRKMPWLEKSGKEEVGPARTQFLLGHWTCPRTPAYQVIHRQHHPLLQEGEKAKMDKYMVDSLKNRKNQNANVDFDEETRKLIQDSSTRLVDDREKEKQRKLNNGNANGNNERQNDNNFRTIWQDEIGYV